MANARRYAAASVAPVDALDFGIDLLDRHRAFAEARARLFASADRVTLGRYQLRQRVGAGSWGTVYQAFDPLMARPVAVKVMHDRVDERPDAIARWRQEAQLLARLDHPHLIPIYDVGVEAGRAYLVTEMVAEGRTLTQWLRHRTVDAAELVRRFVPLADALSAMHARGILHRDIKPDNILVDASGAFRLGDFGLATERSALAGQQPTLEGTPAFLPPEVRRGAVPDERSDVYSLCGSLWFGLCGTPPGSGTPPRQLRPLFDVGLAHAPARRFASAEALLRALERAAEGVSTAPRFAATLALALVFAAAAIPQTPAAAPAPDTTASLTLALGQARRRDDDIASAEHLLEAAFFRASALDDVDVASVAALERFESATDDADRWGAEIWEAEARVWLSRRPTADADLQLRLATARSKRLALEGRVRDALAALPAEDIASATATVAIDAWSQRGELLERSGDLDAGLRAFEQAHTLALRLLPPEHPRRRSTRWNIAATQFERGDFDAAAETFEALLRADEGPPLRPSEVAELHRNLGAVYYQREELGPAITHTKRALEFGHAAYGASHPRTLETLQNLAALLYADGQLDAARAMGWRAVTATEAAYGSEDPRLASMLANLAVMHMTQEEAPRAEALLSRAADIVREHWGSAHRELAAIEVNLARVHHLRGQRALAIDTATSAVEIYASTLGPEHPESAEAALLLATLKSQHSARTPPAGTRKRPRPRPSTPRPHTRSRPRSSPLASPHR